MGFHSRHIGAAVLACASCAASVEALANPRAPQQPQVLAPAPAPAPVPAPVPASAAAPVSAPAPAGAPLARPAGSPYQGLYAAPPVYGYPSTPVPSAQDPRAGDPLATTGAAIFAGCFAGLHGGASWNNLRSRELHSSLAAVPEQKMKLSSVLAGAQAGCDWAKEDMLFGVEAEVSGAFRSSGKASHVVFSQEMTKNELSGAERPHFALSLRTGVVADRALYYVKLGGAYSTTRIDQSYENGTFTQTGMLFSPYIGYNTRTQMERLGLLMGAGVEYLIAPKWSVKAEYNMLYTPRGESSGAQTGRGVSWTYTFDENGVATKTETPVTGLTRIKSIASMRNLMKVGVNRRF